MNQWSVRPHMGLPFLATVMASNHVQTHPKNSENTNRRHEYRAPQVCQGGKVVIANGRAKQPPGANGSMKTQSRRAARREAQGEKGAKAFASGQQLPEAEVAFQQKATLKRERRLAREAQLKAEVK